MKSILIALLNRHAPALFPQEVQEQGDKTGTFSVQSQNLYNYELPFKRWYGDLFEIIKQDKASGMYALPSKIEFHPGAWCNYRCEYCIGQGFLPVKEKFELHKALELISETAPFTHQYIFSGQYTEPFTNPHTSLLIKHATYLQKQVGIYTNGYLLNNRTTELLTSPDVPAGSYVTFNLSSLDPTTYQAIYRPAASAGSVVDIVRNNIEYFDHMNAQTASSAYQMNFTYHVRDINAAPIQLKAMIEWVSTLSSPRILRFSVPLTPLALIAAEKNGRFQSTGWDMYAKVRAYIKALRKEYETGTFRIVTMPIAPDNTTHPLFEHCYAMINSFVVASSGDVYPCCYTANPSNTGLHLGNIRTESFWDIWYGGKRKRVFEQLSPEQDCVLCSRNDHTVNGLFGR
jgi:radical SAM protein with 4Fe4S-binding SPASM domain